MLRMTCSLWPSLTTFSTSSEACPYDVRCIAKFVVDKPECFGGQQESMLVLFSSDFVLALGALCSVVVPLQQPRSLPAQHESLEDRGCFMEDFWDRRGTQHDSWPRATRARQMQPKASSLLAYKERVFCLCSMQGLPLSRVLQPELEFVDEPVEKVCQHGDGYGNITSTGNSPRDSHSHNARRSRQDSSQQGDGLPLQQPGARMS